MIILYLAFLYIFSPVSRYNVWHPNTNAYVSLSGQNNDLCCMDVDQGLGCVDVTFCLYGKGLILL